MTSKKQHFVKSSVKAVATAAMSFRFSSHNSFMPSLPFTFLMV